jgi:flagellar protein FliO/FliZ
VAELALRLVCSLAVVVGLLLLLARVVGRRFQGKTGAAIQVLHRQPLTRGSGVAVVTVADPDELELPHEYGDTAEEPRVRAVPSHRAASQPTKDGPLAGSVLSADTWRQALRVARGTSRAS